MFNDLLLPRRQFLIISTVMKRLFISMIAVGLINFTYAQEGKINIEQDASISKLLEVYKTSNSNMAFYTIQVGFGSYSKAEELNEQVKIDFKDLPSKIIFDSPTYRVQIGQFRTKLEAERKFNEVRMKYPESIILKPEKTTL
jgi:cell division protein FtsN